MARYASSRPVDSHSGRDAPSKSLRMTDVRCIATARLKSCPDTCLARGYFLATQLSKPAPRGKDSDLDHLQQAFAAGLPIVAGEDVGADFNQAGQHIEDQDRCP